MNSPLQWKIFWQWTKIKKIPSLSLYKIVKTLLCFILETFGFIWNSKFDPPTKTQVFVPEDCWSKLRFRVSRKQVILCQMRQKKIGVLLELSLFPPQLIFCITSSCYLDFLQNFWIFLVEGADSPKETTTTTTTFLLILTENNEDQIVLDCDKFWFQNARS